MADLTPKEVREMFKALGLDSDDQRKRFADLVAPEEPHDPEPKVFLRLASSTSAEEDEESQAHS